MERTCLVTKQKREAVELLRFTIQGGQLKFDKGIKNVGRGGYVIKDVTVISKLLKLKGKIKYLLKVKGDFEVGTDELDYGKELCNS